MWWNITNNLISKNYSENIQHSPFLLLFSPTFWFVPSALFGSPFCQVLFSHAELTRVVISSAGVHLKDVNLPFSENEGVLNQEKIMLLTFRSVLICFKGWFFSSPAALFWHVYVLFVGTHSFHIDFFPHIDWFLHCR